MSMNIASINYDSGYQITGFTRIGDLAELVQYRSEIDSPGFDAVGIGDSIPVTCDPMSSNLGGAMEARNAVSACRYFLRGCQIRLNPVGIMGGPGTMLLTHGTGTYQRLALPCNTTTPPTPGTGGDSYLGLDAAAKGTGARQLGFAAGSARFGGFNFTGSDSTSGPDKTNVKTFCVIYRQFVGGGTIYMDSAVSSWPNKDAGSVKAQIITDGAGIYGKRSPIYTLASETAVNRIALRGGLSGGDVFIDGIIGFNGDQNSGFRFHDLFMPGSRIELWSEESRQASIDAYTARDGSPASNGRLFIVSFITNDANAAIAIETWKAQVRALVTRIKTRGAKIMWVIPPEPIESGLSAGRLVGHWRPYRSALYEIQAESDMQFAIFDMGEFVGNRVNDIANYRHGFQDDDRVHNSYHGHAEAGIAWANFITQCLGGRRA